MIQRLSSLTLAGLARVGIAEETRSRTEVIDGRKFGTVLTLDAMQPKSANSHSVDNTPTKSRP